MRFLVSIFLLFVGMVYGQQQATHSVYFALDSHALSQTEATELNSFFDNLVNKDLLTVTIYGYTDDQGSREYNLALSKRRVQAVQEWLLDHRIELSNIEKKVAGKGEIQLDTIKQSKSVDQVRASNRRVDITFAISADNMQKHGITNIHKEEVQNDKKKTPQPTTERDTLEKAKDAYLSDEVEPFKSLLSDSLEVGQYIRLDNILFEKARSTILPESIPVLERMAEILNERENIHFEIHGHVCCINIKYDDALDRNTGTEKLSVNRARKIWVKLVRAGISRRRMSYKGFGPKRPLGGPDKLDRRVELLITKVVPD